MTAIPPWVGPTIAISLVVIALSFVLIGTVTLLIALALRRQNIAIRQRLVAAAAEVRALGDRLKGEVEGFVDLSADARRRLRTALDAVDGRLRDLDALVEVLQEEAEATALDVAALVRTVRRSGALLGMARSMRARRRGT